MKIYIGTSLCLLFVLFSYSTNLQAQLVSSGGETAPAYKGTIKFADGSIVSDKLIYIPLSTSKTVEYKAKKVAKVKSYKFEEIESINFEINGEDVLFEKLLAGSVTRKKGLKTKEYWATVVLKGHMTLYQNDFAYYAMRTTEDYATLLAVHTFAGGKNLLSKIGIGYFKDYPELAQRLADKEFKPTEVEDVVRIYNKWKEKN